MEHKLLVHVHVHVRTCTCMYVQCTSILSLAPLRLPLQGFNRRSNTGSLAAQAPPTVVHGSSSITSSSATAEHAVNRRGNTDPLAAQAPPTVVHNVHGSFLSKLLVTNVPHPYAEANTCIQHSS